MPDPVAVLEHLGEQSGDEARWLALADWLWDNGGDDFASRSAPSGPPSGTT
jgi:hypothetical protein